MWSMDTFDASGAKVKDEKKAYKADAAKHPDPGMSLQHETHENTVEDVLPYALEHLARAGYQFTTVSACTGVPAYQETSATLPTRDVCHFDVRKCSSCPLTVANMQASWTCDA